MSESSRQAPSLVSRSGRLRRSSCLPMPTIRRALTVLGVVVYLCALGGFLLQSVIGDTALFPVSYFFKWDMFPSHNTRSLRRVAVGRTAAGRLLLLHPSSFEQYRAGGHGDLTLVETGSRGDFFPPALRHALPPDTAHRRTTP